MQNNFPYQFGPEEETKVSHHRPIQMPQRGNGLDQSQQNRLKDLTVSVRRTLQYTTAEAPQAVKPLDLMAVLQLDNSANKRTFLQVANELLGPHYQVQKLLGIGGMGVVILAEEKLFNSTRQVAIKLNLESNDPIANERFLQEAQSTAALKHPHIVGIHSIGNARGIPTIVLEYIPYSAPGSNAFVKDRPEDFSILDAFKVSKQIVSALQYAHSKGVIHRDLKLENILVTPDETIKLMDFGLARQRNEQVSMEFSRSQTGYTVDENRLTQEGEIMGTLRYMAPESFHNPGKKPADIYALGLMFYELFTGETEALRYSKGMESRSPLGKYFQYVALDAKKRPAIATEKEDPFLEQFARENPKQHRAIVTFLQRMTAYDANNRPTIHEVAEWLDQTMQNIQTGTTPRRLPLTLGLVSSLMILGGTSWTTISMIKESGEEPVASIKDNKQDATSPPPNTPETTHHQESHNKSQQSESKSTNQKEPQLKHPLEEISETEKALKQEILDLGEKFVHHNISGGEFRISYRKPMPYDDVIFPKVKKTKAFYYLYQFTITLAKAINDPESKPVILDDTRLCQQLLEFLNTAMNYLDEANTASKDYYYRVYKRTDIATTTYPDDYQGSEAEGILTREMPRIINQIQRELRDH